MADDIVFGGAQFSTVAMKPVGDEEINALWGRKIADNTIRAVGEVATIVLGTTTLIGRGSGVVDLTPYNFSGVPKIQVVTLRGGTQPSYNPFYVDGANFYGNVWWIEGGTFLYINHYPDAFSNVNREFTVGTGRSHWGTQLVFLSGQ
jgi:hypothetical protein